MTKKIFSIFILLITFSSFSLACQCTSQIINIFQQITNYVVDQNINPATSNTAILINQIIENTAKITEENQELNKLLELEKQKSIEANRLVFLLNKTIELNNLE